MQQSLHDIFLQGHLADKVLQRQLKSNRKWGSHDRRLLAEGVYDIVRWWRKLLYAIHEDWPQTDVWGADSKQNGDLVFQRVIEAWCWLNDVELDRSVARSSLLRSSVLQRWNEANLPSAIAHSIPDWLDDWGQTQLGARWPEVMHALNAQAPVFLRANLIRTTAPELKQILAREKIETELVSGDCLKLALRSNVFLTQAFKGGLFEVQDLHSQQVALRLMPEAGQRVIDACAGAGGKSLHLASMMQNRGRVVALDVVMDKLDQLRVRASRNGANLIEARPIESSKTIKRLHESADRLLLDVPCSGLGVLRRNPDAKWRLRPSGIEELIQLQREILQSYSLMCKPGGYMVYATCSILPKENQDQVDWFMAQNETQWKLLSAETLWPEPSGGDGFFIAKFQRY